MIGTRFSRLLVLESVAGRGRKAWSVRCDCGAEKVVFETDLRASKVKSCGCLNRELTIARNTKHGLAPRSGKSRLYWVWTAMIQRCENPKNKHWKDYGGRGIVVCARWRQDYAAFVADMGPRPTPKHQIDRRDNDGPYAPDNCYWATVSENAKNRRPGRWPNGPAAAKYRSGR